MITPEEILFSDAIKALRRKLAKLPGKANPDEAFAGWLLPKYDLGFRLADAAQFAAKRTGAQRSYRDVAVLGFAAAAEVLEPVSWEALKSGLLWVSGREPFIDGQPMDFCTDPVSLLGIALGAKLLDQDSIQNAVTGWMKKFISQSSHSKLEEWQIWLLAAIEQLLLLKAVLPIPDTNSTKDIQIALQVKGLLPQDFLLHEEGKTEVLSLIKREVARELHPCHAALRIAAFDAIIAHSTDLYLSKADQNNKFIVGVVGVSGSSKNSTDKISGEVRTSIPKNIKDFFISYTGSDRTWAEWIAWVLEEAGYSVVIQAWDFRPGGNFVLDMQEATEANRTIAVISFLYLQKPFPQSEWAATFAQDLTSTNRKIIPVRVEECNPSGLLGQIVYVDVFNCEETEAQQRLLAAVKDGRMKPELRPMFPGKVVERQVAEYVPFPGTSEEAVQNPQSVTSQPATKVLTPLQKHRLEQRRSTLEDERRIREDKLRQLRKSEAIEAGIAIKFQLQQQIRNEEAELAKLNEELDVMEKNLFNYGN